MKISELINILNEYKEKYGDRIVYLIETDSNGYDIIRNPHLYYNKEYQFITIK